MSRALYYLLILFYETKSTNAKISSIFYSISTNSQLKSVNPVRVTMTIHTQLYQTHASLLVPYSRGS